MKNLAPICIGTYSRLAHLKKTIAGLQSNTLAKKSDLYIFSDAAQPGDEGIVSKLRQYIYTIDGFKSVNIIERMNNDRVANCRGGMKDLLDKYGKTIFLEDDIVTAPGFLQFINDGLEFYKNDERILSISGYSPPLKYLKNYNKDVYILQRFSTWGFGTWTDKFTPFGFEIEKHGVDSFLSDKKAINQFQKNGVDMYSMLLKEKEGLIDALDVKLMFYEFKYDMFTLYPKKSLVQNIGHDGTGLHCGITDKFDVDLWRKLTKFNFEKNIQLNDRIIKANREFRNGTKWSKLLRIIKRLLRYLQKHILGLNL